MGLFNRNKKEDDSLTPKEPLSWDELKDRVDKIDFKFRFGSRFLSISNLQIKILCLCFVMFVFGAFFNTAFHWLFFSSKGKQQQETVTNIHSKRNIKQIIEEDKSTIEYEEYEIEKAQRRLNQRKKRIAIDSLIDNNVFTKESLEAINKLYPDSICGC